MRRTMVDRAKLAVELTMSLAGIFWRMDDASADRPHLKTGRQITARLNSAVMSAASRLHQVMLIDIDTRPLSSWRMFCSSTAAV